MIQVKKLKTYLLMAPIAALLSACGGGSCITSNNDIKIAVSGPLQYFANQPESTYVTFQVTNLSSITVTNISYSVPNATNQTKPTGYSSSQTNVHFNSNECNSIAAGKSCNLSATIDPWSNPGVFDVVAVTESANQSTKLSVQSLLAQGTTSTSSNISLNGQPPTCGQSGQLFCILSVNTVNASATTPYKTIYVSVLNESNVAYDTFNLVDGNSNNYNTTLIGTLDTRQYGVNTYQTQVPNDPNATVTIQATAANQGTSICSGINCSNAESVSIVQSNAGVLLVQPNNFNLASNYRSQVITLSNIGNGQISRLVTPNVSAPLSITNNSCGSTLMAGSNCQFTLNYSGNTSGSSVLTFSYNNGVNATTSTASVNWFSLIFGTQNGQVYNSATLIPGDAAISIAPNGVGMQSNYASYTIGGFMVVGDDVFVASGSATESVFVSTNGTSPWKVIGGGSLPDAAQTDAGCAISSLKTYAGNFYASTSCNSGGFGDVYASTNNGSGTWTLLGAQLPAPVSNMTIDSAGNLYVGLFVDNTTPAPSSSLFVWLQNGNSWTSFSNSSAPKTTISAIAADESGNYIYSSDKNGIIRAVAAGNPAGVFESVGVYPRNRGFDGNRAGATALAVDQSGNVYAASSQSAQVYVSAGGTGTWTRFGNQYDQIANSLLVSGNTIYLASNSGRVYSAPVYSSSSPSTWVEVAGSSLPYVNANALIAISEGKLYATANNYSYFGYVYSSANGVSAWAPVNAGSLDTNQINSVAVSRNFTYAATPSGNVWVSNQNGIWTLAGNGTVPGGPSAWSFFLATSAESVYVSGANSNVYVSGANGTTPWVAIGGGVISPDAPPNIHHLKVSGSNIYAGCDDGNVYLSTGGGSGDWAVIGGGVLPDNNNGAVSALAVSGSNVYAGDPFGNIYLSSSSGADAWAVVGSGSIPDSVAVTSLAVGVSGNVYAAVNPTGTGGVVYQSVGGTGAWTPIGGGPLTNGAAINSITIIGASIYAGATDGNIYVSTNGRNWVNTGYGNGSSVLTLATSSS